LNKGFGKSGLQTALELGLLAFGIKLLLQIVAFEGILVSVVPFRTLPPMLFPLAFRITTGSLAMFEPWMGREPAPTNTARTFFLCIPDCSWLPPVWLKETGLNPITFD